MQNGQQKVQAHDKCLLDRQNSLIMLHQKARDLWWREGFSGICFAASELEIEEFTDTRQVENR